MPQLMSGQKCDDIAETKRGNVALQYYGTLMHEYGSSVLKHGA